jgi:hypothetical protein
MFKSIKVFEPLFLEELQGYARELYNNLSDNTKKSYRGF